MSWVKRVAGVFLGGVSSSGSRGKGVRAPRGRRVVVEALEDRRLLSVGGTYDFGDLPDNYGTTLAADGARHEAVGPTLGALRDAEADGLPTVGADGDDANGSADEDGVTFGEIRVGQLDAQVTVNVQNAPSGAKLDAWIDFDGDGAFGGAWEQIADTVEVSEGDNVVEFDVPSWAVSGETSARFRLGANGNLGPRGTTTEGEVEDYRVTITSLPSSGLFGSQQVIVPTADRPFSVFAADVNADGYMDVLSASYYDNRIVWHENDQHGNFNAHVINESTDGEASLTASDINGDGLMDIVVASSRDREIAWYQNDENGVFTKHVLSNSVTVATSVVTADVNSDGKVDILCGGWGGVRWFENDGSGGFSEHIYGSSRDTIRSVVVSDINRDGYMDILSGGTETDAWEPEWYSVFNWYENDGNEGFTEHTVASSWPTIHRAADVNGDGYADIVAATNDQRLVWYENDGNAGFVSHPITDTEAHYNSLVVADVNADGHPDILCAHASVLSEEGSEIVLHVNDGNGEFAAHTLDTSASSYARDQFSSVFAADMDGDGDLDALSTNHNGTIAWYEQWGAPAVPLGEADFIELTSLALSQRANAYSFSTTRNGHLTTDATFDPAAGDVTLRLLDGQGQLIEEVTGTDGYLRIDHIAPAVGTAYEIQLTGSNTNVDLRICNLVSQTGGAVEVFDTDGDDRYLFTVTDTFNVTANGVEYRFDDASTFDFRSEGGKDTIELVDSAGDDTLTATYEKTTLAGTLPGGQGYSATAYGFHVAHGYAKNGGRDTAELIGSEHTDRAKAYQGLVKLMGPGYYRRAKFFESVEVDMGAGVDAAVLAASDGVDMVWAMKDELRVAHDVELADGEAPAFATVAYGMTIIGAEQVVARARGGDDWIEIHDSALNDVLIAKPNKVEMMNGAREGVGRGAEYRITGRGFGHVSSIADQGGDGDAAKLYDSAEAGVDLWAAGYLDGETWSSMSSPSRLLYEVLAFEHVGGYGFNGGLGEDHGVNRKDHFDDVDFVFQYGYWEGGDEPVSNPRNPRGR
jgi:VCBS repeat protein/GEVED domain-containing protein